jgi:hypothetical protein
MGYELLYFIGALVLLAVIGYGVYRDKTRDKRKDAITEAATREQYEHPDRYQRTQQKYENAAKD